MKALMVTLEERTLIQRTPLAAEAGDAKASRIGTGPLSDEALWSCLGAPLLARMRAVESASDEATSRFKQLVEESASLIANAKRLCRHIQDENAKFRDAWRK